ncbi:MAG: CIA30 family protein [Pseudomonadota bacterium]
MTLRALIAAAVLAASPGGAMAEDGMQDVTAEWRYVADGVMGGVSQGRLDRIVLDGRPAARLTGQVSLDNNGGFIQLSTDFAPDTAAFDASGWTGLELDVQGNGEIYEARVKTSQVTRPWQSYRVAFTAPRDWATIRIPFADLVPYRIDAPFDPAQLRRLGLVAVGRAFEVDLAVAALRLYR